MNRIYKRPIIRPPDPAETKEEIEIKLGIRPAVGELFGDIKLQSKGTEAAAEELREFVRYRGRASMASPDFKWAKYVKPILRAYLAHANK